MSRACTDWAVGWISALGERRRTADAVQALRAGQRDGDDALGKDLLGSLRRDRSEMRDVDDRSGRCDREWARRIEMAAVVMRAAVIGMATHGRKLGRVMQALDDRGLVRTEGQLQAIGLRSCQHEPDRQKGTRHQ
jgi:hypothetical protein